MPINSDEAFGIENFGIALKDSDGNVTGYFTSGVGAPSGQDAPLSTLYIDEEGTIWKKAGAGATNWTTSELNKKVPQTAHGFTLPAVGLMPLTFNSVTQKYEKARAHDLNHAASLIAIGFPDSNTITFQEGGLLLLTGHT